MADYANATHAQMYEFAWSGDPTTLHALAAKLAAHHAAVDEATTTLQKQLSTIHHSWQGAAADRFNGRFSETLQSMRQHADSAEQTGKAVGYAADALASARQQMPLPPDALEELVAGIDQNALTAAAAQVFTMGIANSVSASAEQDIQTKHGRATQAMTQLVAAYAHAQAQLPQDVTQAATASAGSNSDSGSGSGGAESQTAASDRLASDVSAAAALTAGLGLGAFATSGAAGLASQGSLASHTAQEAQARAAAASTAQSTEFNDAAGLAAASSAGGEPGTTAAQGMEGAEGQMGGLGQMPGASRGLAAFGKSQERGQRRDSVREDAHTWVSERHRDALPPGGLIE
jgi:WXG100 family type VII secretion target